MATASVDLNKLRAELDEIGARRKEQKKVEQKLTKETVALLRKAYGHLTVEEMARRTGMHRTTLYRVYHPHDG